MCFYSTKGVPDTATSIMSNVRRRILTALILIFLISIMLSINTYAAALDANTESKMDAMGDEVFVWFLAFRACVIPLLIVQYASNGLKLLGIVFLTKGEYKRDDVITNILYSTIAAGVLVLLPVILGWAMDLFKSGAWKPPSTSY